MPSKVGSHNRERPYGGVVERLDHEEPLTGAS